MTAPNPFQTYISLSKRMCVIGEIYEGLVFSNEPCLLVVRRLWCFYVFAPGVLKKDKVHLEVPRHCLVLYSHSFVTRAGKLWVGKGLNAHNYVVLQGKSMEAGAKAGQKLPYNSDN